jgi:hypothetical protein
LVHALEGDHLEAEGLHHIGVAQSGGDGRLHCHLALLLFELAMLRWKLHDLERHHRPLPET